MMVKRQTLLEIRNLILEFIISNIAGMLIITLVYVTILATWMVVEHNYTFIGFITNQRGNLISSIFVGIVTGIITGYVISLYFSKRDKEAARRETGKEIKRNLLWNMDEAWKCLNEMSINLTVYIHILENFDEGELGLQKVLSVRDIRLTNTRIDENVKKLREFEIVTDNDYVKEKYNLLYKSLLDVKIAVVKTIFPDSDTCNNIGVTENNRYKITIDKANKILESVNCTISNFFFLPKDFEVQYKKNL